MKPRNEAAEQLRDRQIYEIALHQAIEQKFAQQQQEPPLRYDPLGVWGPPNYKIREEW
jgi:hypothetical protein